MIPVQNTIEPTLAGGSRNPRERKPALSIGMLTAAVAVFDIKNLIDIFFRRINARPVLVPVRVYNGYGSSGRS